MAVGLSAAPVRHGSVAVELVSSVDSIEPGQSFFVALRMQHDPHWHTFWKNPGTGYPTCLTWTLPKGFTAGEIEWPVPKVFRDASDKTSGFGYEGENLLMVKLTPPADLVAGTNLTLKAHAEWLMCKEVCMPGEANLALTLPVKAEAPATEGKWAQKIAEFNSRLPAGLPSDWSAKAERKDNYVELRLNVGSGERPLASTLYFLSEDGLIDYREQQTVMPTQEGYLFRLAVLETADLKATRLIGVIRAENGWSIASKAIGLKMNTGLSVDVPLALSYGPAR
jgi:thiol:disulfide interchange protein DsbD